MNRIAAATIAVLVAVALAGCTPPDPTPTDSQAPAPSAAQAQPASPTPTPTQVAAAPAPAPAPNPDPPATTHTTDDPCLRASIKTTYTPTDNTAGQAHGIITITNISGVTCNLEGYPSVWFDNPEAQVNMGARAAYDGNNGQLVQSFDLVPGASATAPLTITQAGFVDGCNIVTSIALLVISPLPAQPISNLSQLWQHVDIGATPACSNDNIGLLTVGAMVPS